MRNVNIHIKLGKLALVLALLLIAPAAWGATIYVTNGTANPGTKICYKSGAWPAASCADGTDDKTLEDASTAAGANGTIILDGTANGGLYADGQIGGSVVANTFFIKNSPQTIQNSTDTGRTGTPIIRSTLANYTIRPNSQSLTISGITVSNTKAEATLGAMDWNTPITSLTITNSTVTSTASIGLNVSGTIGTLTITGSSINSNGSKGAFINAVVTTGVVTNSTFNGNGNFGIDGNLGGFTFTGCDFSYNKSHGFVHDQASTAAIVVTQSTSHDNCNDNTVGAMVGVCAAANSYRHGFTVVPPAGGAISNFTFKGNYAYNVDLGLDIQASNNNILNGSITNNIFIGKGLGQTEQGTGLFLGADNASYTNAAINIYQNTIISEDASGQALFVGRYNNTNITLKNNIIKNSAGGLAVKVTASGPYLTQDYNNFYSSAADAFYDKTEAINFTEWKTASSQDANSVFSDPLLTPTYTIPGNSPAIGSGVLITGLHDQATPTTDYAGTAVTWGPSIGAYQPTNWNAIYFDKNAADGGNGTTTYPYNSMDDYPVAKLIHGTAGSPLTIWLKGDFSAEALDFSAYGGPANPVVTIRTPIQNQAANLGALTEKGSAMTLQYYQQQQGIPKKIWDNFTQYTTVP